MDGLLYAFGDWTGRIFGNGIPHAVPSFSPSGFRVDPVEQSAGGTFTHKA